MALMEGFDPRDLAQAGWGIILAANANPAILDALAPLLDLRRKQTGERFRIFQGKEGFESGRDTKTSFLARKGAGPGPADPDRVPYYLLLAGSPEEIPYRFQSQLDIQYAVGRVCFDTLDDYAAYAATVARTEREGARVKREPVRRPCRAVVFGVSHPDDSHTQLSVYTLIQPLADTLSSRYPDLKMTTLIGTEASKRNLIRVLSEDTAPKLLITSGHGIVFPESDPRYVAHQGALVCADWPGPTAWRGPLPPDFYFSADDISDSMHLDGMIALHYSSFSAGASPLQKPAMKDVGLDPYGYRKPLVSKSAKLMLAHRQGGALAVVGLIDQEWGYVLHGDKGDGHTKVVQSVVMRLLDGFPVGNALEYVNDRYAELSVILSSDMEEISFGKQANPRELVQMWTENRDVRSFVTFGDPAVRLASTPCAM
jgi:hypothetical protein